MSDEANDPPRLLEMASPPPGLAELVRDLDAPPPLPPALRSPPAPAPRPRWIGPSIFAVAAGALVVYRLLPGPTAEPPQVEAAITESSESVASQAPEQAAAELAAPPTDGPPTAEAPPPEPPPASVPSVTRPRSPEGRAYRRPIRRRAADRDTGTLRLVTLPWAEVWLRGSRIGTTPLVDQELPAGVHRIRLRNVEQRIDRTVRVEIRAGEVTRLTLDLREPESEPEPEGGEGQLTLITRPPCEVFLGERSLGVTPLRARTLPVGTHRLVLRSREHGLEQAITVRIREGQGTRLNISLR